VGDSTNIKWHEGSVDSATREKAMNQKGCVLWFTGLSGSGKSTVAYTLEHALFQRGKIAQVLDGDNIRHGRDSLSRSGSDREPRLSPNRFGFIFVGTLEGFVPVAPIDSHRARRHGIVEHEGRGSRVQGLRAEDLKVQGPGLRVESVACYAYINPRHHSYKASLRLNLKS
jgi:adenylylsulfate kinase